MRNTRERVQSRLRDGIAYVSDVVTLLGAVVALLRFDSRRDEDCERDDGEPNRSDRFRALFGAALAEFSRNMSAWNVDRLGHVTGVGGGDVHNEQREESSQ
jgi:hypothetical protein